MTFIQARTKYTNGNGAVINGSSPYLQVKKSREKFYVVTTQPNNYVEFSDLPEGINHVRDPDLGTFILWRGLWTGSGPINSSLIGADYSVTVSVYSHFVNESVLRTVNGKHSAIVTRTPTAPLSNIGYPIEGQRTATGYKGKAAVWLNNIRDLNGSAVDRRQYGSLINVISGKWGKTRDTALNTDVFSFLDRNNNVLNLGPDRFRNAIYEASNAPITSLAIGNIALFTREDVNIYRFAGGRYSQINAVMGPVLGCLPANRGLISDVPKPPSVPGYEEFYTEPRSNAETSTFDQVPPIPYNIMALRTTGPNALNSFSADTPYPRIINVQTIAGSRNGYSITGYNLTVAASLGIDLRDTNKYMFMTNLIDATTMSYYWLGPANLTETIREANRVFFSGMMQAPVDGNQYLCVAIVQMRP